MKDLKWYFSLWRLITLFFGVCGLVYGAKMDHASDWDIGVSFLMAGATYLLMPAFDRGLRSFTIFGFMSAACILTVCVDTTYSMYWDYNSNILIDRWVNFPASMSLFLSCWVIWSLIPELAKGLGKTLSDSLIPFDDFVDSSWRPGFTDPKGFGERVDRNRRSNRDRH